MTAVDRIDKLRSLAERKDRPLHWYGLAMELRAAGRLDEALATFERIHTIDERYVPAYFMRAQVLEELDRAAEARDALTDGIARADEQGDGHAAEEMRSMLDTLVE
jgi:tetratricopeptide (TPR) repeat protein